MTANKDCKHQQFAEAIRAACIKAAVDGYQNAAVAGLCHEGAWEAAISSMQMLDLDAVAEQSHTGQK